LKRRSVKPEDLLKFAAEEKKAKGVWYGECNLKKFLFFFEDFAVDLRRSGRNFGTLVLTLVHFSPPLIRFSKDNLVSISPLSFVSTLFKHFFF
jgi:hypothetical protein